MILKFLFSLGLMLSLLVSQAFADREPTTSELNSIESALTGAGFTSWEDIELDDGKWKVDDARHSDGAEYDVELDSSSFSILKKDRDD